MTEQDPNFVMPNMVTDVYKVRSGQWNQVRIWSFIDLGNLRKEDLFVTDVKMDIIPFGNEFQYIEDWDSEEWKEFEEQLEYVNGMRL